MIRMTYLAISLIALVGTWSQNLHYAGDGPGALTRFLADLWVTPASRSISIDIALYFLAGSIWMVSEARRLNMKHVWAYIVFGAVIAISFTFPLFLWQREIYLKKRFI